jgi:hypothetical protein
VRVIPGDAQVPLLRWDDDRRTVEEDDAGYVNDLVW